MTNRQLQNRLKKMYAFLLDRAFAKVEGYTDERLKSFHFCLLKAINLKNLSAGDMDTMNLILELPAETFVDFSDTKNLKFVVRESRTSFEKSDHFGSFQNGLHCFVPH